MSNKQPEVDSGILQFTPKGAYYEEADEQFKKVFQMWSDLFEFDRTLFSLTTLLGGTGFSKGIMSHMLLSNPQSTTGKELVPQGLSFDYEEKVIRYNLTKERTPRALKNLLMLAGGENQKRVNNSRTRKIILQYIFDRDHDDLDNLVVNYKNKLKKLIRHAIGKQDLFKILFGDSDLFEKKIGKYNRNALPVLYHIFGYDIPSKMVVAYFKKIDQCQKLKKAAEAKDVDEFKKLMKGLPLRTVMGYRNTYKVPVDLENVYEKSKISSRDALQSESAGKRAGAKIKVNYKKQDVYDLWKAFYHKIMAGENENIDEISEAIEHQTKRLDKIDIGEAVVIIDASHSMTGSDKRPLHPFLTSLSIMSVLDNIKDIIYVGGKHISVKDDMSIIVPAGHTDLWRGLVEAIMSGAKNILVISDGYENTIKGTFNHVYKHFKDSGYEFELMHINPVFSADSKAGTSRKLVDDVKPLPVSDYKYLETEFIFNKMLENREMVKNLLISKYQKLIGQEE